MIKLQTNYGIHDFNSTIVVYFEKDGIFFSQWIHAVKVVVETC